MIRIARNHGAASLKLSARHGGSERTGFDAVRSEIGIWRTARSKSYSHRLISPQSRSEAQSNDRLRSGLRNGEYFTNLRGPANLLQDAEKVNTIGVVAETEVTDG